MIPRKKLSTVCGLIAMGLWTTATIRFAAAQDPVTIQPPPRSVMSPPFKDAFAAMTAALKPVPQSAPAAGDDELTKLRKECYQHARNEAPARLSWFEAGAQQGSVDSLHECITKRLLPAELALSGQPADQLAAYEHALAILKWIELVNDTRFQAGRIPIQDLMQSRLDRLAIEIKVMEAKRAAQEPPTGRSGGQSSTPATPAAEPPKAPPAARPAPASLEEQLAERDRLQAGALAPPSLLAQAVPTDNELQRLRKQRYLSAHTMLAEGLKAFDVGTAQVSVDTLLGSVTKRLLPAELALCDRPADALAAYQHALAALKWIEWVNDTLFRAGRIPIQDMEQTRFERLSMETKILEAKRAAEAQPSR
jgi:hypothetical protein